MRFEDLNWMDVERYLEQDDRVILVTGATEQHAYLSLLTDILIPSKIAQAAAERENVLVAPAFNFGISRFFADFPGTISITRHTFNRVIAEIFESLLHQGFRRFFFLNGHGGNQLPAPLEIFLEDDEVQVQWYDWWRSDIVRAFEAHHGLKFNHANWGENFPFNRVAESPSDAKPDVGFYNIDRSQPVVRQHLGDGNFGGMYQVSDELMNELFHLVVDDVAQRLRWP
ncbi:MAG: creatininase family protein [Anaerolineaceae bacterium]|nr:creatininase family protein [Anaerolineaceae bacterium]